MDLSCNCHTNCFRNILTITSCNCHTNCFRDFFSKVYGKLLICEYWTNFNSSKSFQHSNHYKADNRSKQSPKGILINICFEKSCKLLMKTPQLIRTEHGGSIPLNYLSTTKVPVTNQLLHIHWRIHIFSLYILKKIPKCKESLFFSKIPKMEWKKKLRNSAW